MCAAKRLSEMERKKEIMNSATKVILEKALKRQLWKTLLLVQVYLKGSLPLLWKCH